MRLSDAIARYLWNLGAALSILLNAAFWPGARRGETVCAHCARARCRFCITLGRVANLFEPDHFRESRQACETRSERLRGEIQAALKRYDEGNP